MNGNDGVYILYRRVRYKGGGRSRRIAGSHVNFELPVFRFSNLYFFQLLGFSLFSLFLKIVQYKGNIPILWGERVSVKDRCTLRDEVKGIIKQIGAAIQAFSLRASRLYDAFCPVFIFHSIIQPVPIPILFTLILETLHNDRLGNEFLECFSSPDYKSQNAV